MPVVMEKPHGGNEEGLTARGDGMVVMSLQGIRSPLLMEDILESFKALRRQGQDITLVLPVEEDRVLVDGLDVK